MRLLAFNNSDREGGGASVAVGLHQELLAGGDDVRLLVQRKGTDIPGIVGPRNGIAAVRAASARYIDMLPLLHYPRWRIEPFYSGIVSDHSADEIARFRPDIVHLHCVDRGMLRVENIARIRRPVVWSIHNCWPFTGGCFLPGDCQRYTECCGSCPVLGSQRPNDLSRWNWERKHLAYRQINLTIVAPSHWMASYAGSSALIRGQKIEVIPNGLNLDIFRPRIKAECRRQLSLPADALLLLYGANQFQRDRNKGFHLLAPIIELVARRLEREVVLVVFGSSRTVNLPVTQVKLLQVGYVTDRTILAKLYAASDVLLMPSLQETFGLTAAESLACGTPVVAFATSGLLDVIDHKRTGYLARPYEVEDFAQGVTWVTADRERHANLAAQARSEAARRFSIHSVAQRYRDLYREIVEDVT
ncbi:MAG: glycosyltransferase [Candidatus Edwardsbacteria bacterium]|nr:glycosyltransferase [Candidatus Edwardsbacteria bacterium]